MKKIKLTFLLALLVSACSPTGSSSSSENSSSSSSSSTPSSSEPVQYASLEDAFKNMKSYVLHSANVEEHTPIEIYDDSIYYYDYNAQGYIEIEEEPDYVHFLGKERVMINENEVYDRFVVYGRASYAGTIPYLVNNSFIQILGQYISYFEKVGLNEYAVPITNEIVNDMAYDFKNFFQTKEISYCNVFTVTVGANDKIESISLGEDYDGYRYIVRSYTFKDFDLSKINAYTAWEEAGRKIITRIIDFKMLISGPNGIDEDSFSPYEDEEVTFNAFVTAFDADGNVSVANYDKNYGYIGVKVHPSSLPSDVALYDEVTISGVVQTDNRFISIKEGVFTKTGNKMKYALAFDEETIVDVYGGGVYLSNLFEYAPYFYTYCLYSTFAYVSDLDLYSESEDIIASLSFLDMLDVYQKPYKATLIIDKDLSADFKQNVYSALESAKNIYGQAGSEMYFGKVLFDYDFDNDTFIFHITEDSEINPRLSASEKVEKYVGIADFPIINDSSVSFRFGGSSEYYLEDYYGIEPKDTQGVYITYDNILEVDYNTFINDLGNIGFTLLTRVKDEYGLMKHSIYQNGDYYVDILYANASYYDEFALEIFVYQKDQPVLPKGLLETLEELVGDFFNVDEFIYLEDTYDGDYSIYNLKNYAGNDFSDNPLTVVALDMKQTIDLQGYAKQYLDAGYSQFRDENNKAITHKVRGRIAYVLHKEDAIIEICTFPTSDYTYTGSDDFLYRMEIVIYQGNEPMDIKTYDSIDKLGELYEQRYGQGGYKATLPEDAKVEMWFRYDGYQVTYGFGSRDEAFIYTSDVDAAFDSVVEAVKEAGYTQSVLSDTRASFHLGMDCYVSVLKESKKGYVRVLNDVLGLKFFPDYVWPEGV